MTASQPPTSGAASPKAAQVVLPRWRDGRLMLGVLIVLASVVLGSRVVSGAQRSEQVWRVQRDLTLGSTVTAADLDLVAVRLDAVSARYVRATDPDPAGYVLTRSVSAGELLPAAAVQPAGTNVLARVTVSVERFHFPAGLDRGQRVDVYVTARAPAGKVENAPPTRVLSDVLVAGLDRDATRFGSGGALSGVVLAVRPEQVPDLVAAVRNGALDLVALDQASLDQTARPAGS